MITITRTDSDHPEFRELIVLLDRTLRILDGDDHAFYAQFNKTDKIRHAIVAYCNGQAAGTGAIRQFSDGEMEVKRMFVRSELRGKGIAQAILKELEKWSAELGFSYCILETGKQQAEAIRLYEKAGYTVIPNYGPYAGVDNSICMKKKIR